MWEEVLKPAEYSPKPVGERVIKINMKILNTYSHLRDAFKHPALAIAVAAGLAVGSAQAQTTTATFHLGAQDSGTAITAQYGSTLTGWTDAVHDGTDVIITVSDDSFGAGIDKVEVKLRRSTLAPGGKLFARLNVVVTMP